MFSYKLSTISILLFATCLSTYFNVAFCNGLVTDMDMETIMCYNCTSQNNNEACADPMGETDMIDCKKGENCLKIVFTTINNKTETIRSCAPSNASCSAYTADLTKKNGNFKELNCKICNIDHCNSATSFGLSLAVLVMPIIINYL
ncbi:uncharacterized protein [Euwallacea similis]|uniref:uncharacterized protein n=1 Tax=Euwallacea similis TaxID=1736056 RepID=UPI00344EEAD2